MNWRGIISLAVLSAGLVGAVSYFGRPNANTERPDGAGTLVSNEPSRESLPRDEGRAAKAFRTFAPQGTWFNTVSAGAMEEPPGMRGALSANSTPWQTVIIEEAGGDGPTRVNIAKPGRDRELTQALQLELKRVHCYDGPIDGEWLFQSKRAMRAFLDRVNASLPIDEPDRILLTLIKGHVAAACGQVCPEGQSLAADGRCLPMATPAAALVVKTPTLPTEVAASDMTSTGMMIGGPKPEPRQKSNVPSVIENLFKHPLGSP